MVRTTHRRSGSCLFPFALAVLVIVFSCACLAVVGFALRQSTGDSSRTNVLILGLDRRPEQGYVARSDVLMLMTVYPPGPLLALLSIPRDLYVHIPRHGRGRINTAHFWGESEAEGGGTALAMETVAKTFDVPVHGYVRLDFDGFRTMVDAVGGIDVVVEEGIVDDAYPTADYGTTRIEIPDGPQHMDGETALRYVRSRHGSSDFDRAARQQQVVIALVRRLSGPRGWARLPAVFGVVIDHVDTDLGLGRLIQLVITVLRVGPDGIEHHVIDREMTRPWTTPTGGAVLLPRWEAIAPLVEEVFGP
ncbi:MAG: LCP family protein [Anaerolineae bacterium]|jgi:LCP family protein required for cell wall assembly